MRPLPHIKTWTLATVVTLAGLAASAFTVDADTEAQLCRVDPNSPSQVREFWDGLEKDVVAARVAEIDKASPGFAQELAQYQAGAPVADLQKRITDAGGQEGLGMLITQTATDAGVAPTNDPEFQTEYTEQQARAAAEQLGDNPAAAITETLNAQAASGVRIDALRAEMFTARAADYNATQQQLASNLTQCADTLADARPMPWTQKALIAAAVLAAIGVALRAWCDAREQSRHQAKH